MDNSQNYELAYHLNPDLDETKVREAREKIDNLITSAGGTISFSREPEKTRLSYPLKHKRTSYFGYAQFSASPTAPEYLNEHLKLENDILRYMTIKLESDLQKQQILLQRAKIQKRLERQRAQSAKSAAQAKEKAMREAAKKEKVPEKEMEKQLEEIIEKL